MTLKIFGHPMSTCTQRIISVLNELDQPFELELIDLSKGAHKSPEFLAKQPFGKIPVLQDGDVQIFESRTIIRYLAKKYADKVNLIGGTPKEQALVDNWLEAESQYYNPPVSGIVGEKIFAPMYGRTTDEAAVEKHLATLEGVLDAYETVLSDGRTFIAGEKYSIADASHLPYGSMLVNAANVKEPFEKRPHFKAWWDRITARPNWQKIVAPK